MKGHVLGHTELVEHVTSTGRAPPDSSQDAIRFNRNDGISGSTRSVGFVGLRAPLNDLTEEPFFLRVQLAPQLDHGRRPKSVAELLGLDATPLSRADARHPLVRVPRHGARVTVVVLARQRRAETTRRRTRSGSVAETFNRDVRRLVSIGRR